MSDNEFHDVIENAASLGARVATAAANETRFGSRPYRKRYLVTIIADSTTDGGDDWAATLGDGLGSEHCLWDVELLESVELTEAGRS